ncbi:ABC transporter ATP-binding protein [Cohnella terricola]|uniref:ABC transporter ATP-binding protein n=1 Tax=Cohnella terricola TaxID=1289167 RepID=A0A559JWM6_9BACL|nr:ABC transporter ATP-binding protein [Cohnella terricola]TVY04292.1 ABC transporter ATP-binding protein [Cohnella terricola]
MANRETAVRADKPAIEVIGATKVLNGRKIIDRLSFSVERGEIYGFLGPNGAGKTTTIRMMVGLIRMNEGDIRIQGHSIRTDRKRALAEVGAIVENPELYRYLTGRQNLQQYANLCERPIDRQRIDEVIRLVRLEDAIDRKVRTYSLGMRQRLGIAQAILHRPSLLLLDEPTNGLDPAGIRELRDYLRQLAREENMAIVVSSHLLSEIELLCDRVIIIQKGRFVAERTLKEEATTDVLSFEIELAESDENKDRMAQHLESRGFEKVDDSGRWTIPIRKEHVPALIESLVQDRVPLMQARIRTTALEDLFLRLTEEGIR